MTRQTAPERPRRPRSEPVLVAAVVLTEACLRFGLDSRDSAECHPERGEAFGDDAIPNPQRSLLAGDESGVDEDLHVVADGRLGAPGWLDEVAGAGLTVGRRGDHGEQAEPGGISERSEGAGEGFGLVGVEDVGADRRAAELGLEGFTCGAGAHAASVSKNVDILQ